MCHVRLYGYIEYSGLVVPGVLCIESLLLISIIMSRRYIILG